MRVIFSRLNLENPHPIPLLCKERVKKFESRLKLHLLSVRRYDLHHTRRGLSLCNLYHMSTLRPTRPRRAERIRLALEARAEAVFTSRHSPFHYLGGIILFQMGIVLVTGIYLLIFYETSMESAYESVESLARDQWYAGGIMRSLHRYASDGMVLTLILHVLRMVWTGRFRDHRWLAWVSGVGLLLVVLIEGISGYWMVWDQQAQLLAVKTVEFLDALPFFGEPLSRAFLVNEGVSSIFFFIMLFLHLVLPLALGLFFWFHVSRISRPAYWPPARMAWALGLMLLALSLVKPALSNPPADLRLLPTEVAFDWFYLFLYPVFDLLSPRWAWVALVLGFLVFALVPWILKAPIRAKAEVKLRACDGCALCHEDCPYEAITMRPRSDGRLYALEAAVVPERCAGCGICTGACDRMAINLPWLHSKAIRREIRRLLAHEGLPSPASRRVPASPAGRESSTGNGSQPPSETLLPGSDTSPAILLFLCEYSVPPGIQGQQTALMNTPPLCKGRLGGVELREALPPPSPSFDKLRTGTYKGGEAISLRTGALSGMPNVRVLALPCIGMVHPRFIERALRQGAEGVFLCGCRMGDCRYREGNTWLEARLSGLRPPVMKEDIDRARVRVAWLDARQEETLRRALEEFSDYLSRHRSAYLVGQATAPAPSSVGQPTPDGIGVAAVTESFFLSPGGRGQR